MYIRVSQESVNFQQQKCCIQIFDASASCDTMMNSFHTQNKVSICLYFSRQSSLFFNAETIYFETECWLALWHLIPSLVLKNFPQTLQECVTPKMWFVSMCFIMLVFWSSFPHTLHVNTLFLSLPTAIQFSVCCIMEYILSSKSPSSTSTVWS